jgi:hypothetical protein
MVALSPFLALDRLTGTALALHYAPLSVQEDFSHLSWLPRVSLLWSWGQKSRAAVPRFHRRLGSLPSALGGIDEHGIMAIEKKLGKDYKR